MKTFKEAREARAVKYAAEAAADRAAAAKAAELSPTDPRVGVLCRNGKPVYYAFIAGQYVEAKRLATIVAKLEADEVARMDEIDAW